MYYHYGVSPFGTILEIIGIILLIVLIVRLLGFGGPRMMHRRHHMMGRSSALDMLEERYAKGEIDKTEFDQKRKDLLG